MQDPGGVGSSHDIIITRTDTGVAMAGTELERAERNFAQAKARLRALRNREAVRQRKLETRRRVILGGALIDLEKRDDAAAAMLDRLVRNLSRDQDRTAFEGWALRAEDGPGVEAAGTAGVAGLDVGAGRDAGAGAETRAGMDAGADGGGSAAPAPALSMNRGA